MLGSEHRKEGMAMNQYFDYPEKKYWNAEMWSDTISPIWDLVKWIEAHDAIDDAPYDNPVDGLYDDAAKALPFYDRKTNALSIPEVVQYWKDRGVHYERRSQGGMGWLIMCPDKCLEDFGTKYKTLVVFHSADLSDPYWAMKTLEKYRAYNEMVAQQQDLVIFYICAAAPDEGRIYVNILQEGFVFVPGDVNDVWLDVSTVLSSDAKLSEIKGLRYPNPDAAVTQLGAAKVPVIDITHRWENKTSLTRDQVSMENWSNQRYCFKRVMCSETGRKMAEGIALEYDYNKVTDEAFLAYWAGRGVQYESHETKYRRWKAALPMGALENPEEKLPVICIMQEVNHANEHLAVTEASYFYEYFRICTQGACMLISFVLEDADSNDLLAEIITEAKRLYPMMDMSRVYIAGHSHNGHYALEFAYRHPELIAAVATYGDPPGLANMGITPMTEERAEKVARIDMPVINLDGMNEHGSHYPISEDAHDIRGNTSMFSMMTVDERVKGWQLRLKASNCPMKTREDILATRYSDEKAVRELGIPGDRSQVVWLDGFELYIVEIKNNDGKYHLCMVGEQNMPHNTTPNQQVVSWNFLRRFARDRETMKIIEVS